jgi:lipoprotein-anchoring transpeptidase ErfK/SrfK
MLRALTLALLTLLLAAPAASAQDPVVPPAPEEPRIRAGVTVSGVDVGNLTLAEAEARLTAALGPKLEQDVTVRAKSHRWTLPVRKLRFEFRADRTAQRAFNAGTAAPPAADGTLPPASATPSVSFKRDPLWTWAKKQAKTVAKAPRDARVRIALTKIHRVPGKTGRELEVGRLVKAIEKVLADPLAARTVKGGFKRVKPAVKTRELRKLYKKVITIDRSSFTLRLFKKFRVIKRYGVAVGMPAYPTPTGLFSIQSKQVNPTWTAPNSPWAGEMAGQQVAGGAPDNPLRARWMGVSGSVGIHGTGQPWSIGSRASHGCIRMTVPDVIDLFRRVELGTPVLVR